MKNMTLGRQKTIKRDLQIKFREKIKKNKNESDCIMVYNVCMPVYVKKGEKKKSIRFSFFIPSGDRFLLIGDVSSIIQLSRKPGAWDRSSSRIAITRQI